MEDIYNKINLLKNKFVEFYNNLFYGKSSTPIKEQQLTLSQEDKNILENNIRIVYDRLPDNIKFDVLTNCFNVCIAMTILNTNLINYNNFIKILYYIMIFVNNYNNRQYVSSTSDEHLNITKIFDANEVKQQLNYFKEFGLFRNAFYPVFEQLRGYENKNLNFSAQEYLDFLNIFDRFMYIFGVTDFNYYQINKNFFVKRILNLFNLKQSYINIYFEYAVIKLHLRLIYRILKITYKKFYNINVMIIDKKHIISQEKLTETIYNNYLAEIKKNEYNFYGIFRSTIKMLTNHIKFYIKLLSTTLYKCLNNYEQYLQNNPNKNSNEIITKINNLKNTAFYKFASDTVIDIDGNNYQNVFDNKEFNELFSNALNDKEFYKTFLRFIKHASGTLQAGKVSGVSEKRKNLQFKIKINSFWYLINTYIEIFQATVFKPSAVDINVIVTEFERNKRDIDDEIENIKNKFSEIFISSEDFKNKYISPERMIAALNIRELVDKFNNPENEPTIKLLLGYTQINYNITDLIEEYSILKKYIYDASLLQQSQVEEQQQVKKKSQVNRKINLLKNGLIFSIILAGSLMLSKSVYNIYSKGGSKINLKINSKTYPKVKLTINCKVLNKFNFILEEKIRRIEEISDFCNKNKIKLSKIY